MEILSDELELWPPGATQPRRVRGGESFQAAANAKFRMEVKTLTDYCCSFVK